MPFADWERVPRHPDWKYEYWDGAAQLSYRPRGLHVRRATDTPISAGRHTGRLFDATRDTAAVRAFLREVWSAEDPCVTFDDQTAQRWLTDTLDESLRRLTAAGGAIVEEDAAITGALLVELPYRDDEAPWLCWLSVRSGHRCDGVATALLATVVPALHAAGVTHVDSYVSTASKASVSWHWRHGFALVADPMAGHGPHARRR